MGGCFLKNITNKVTRVIVLLAVAVSALSAPPAPPFRITTDMRAAVNHISADSLRGHLSFIASDALEGRNTPSRGLDIAAEYIAAQFRRAGLEPVGDDGYFQTTSLQPKGAEQPVKVRNVIGLLRGSDPVLKDSYVLVTAHYDHLGTKAGADDTIFNGANDDGSGTVSVIELASALASLKKRPRRSLVFMTFFGEEKGLLGSHYYGQHPIFPIDKTVADINLEQVGRTDSNEGPQLNNASMTGYDFSDIGAIFKAAGELTGIKVYKHPRNSDAFFGRSDNQALANQGVPAHTLCVAYVYPDYHGLGDHWDKIDYQNLAKVNRAVAVGLLMIANNPRAPRWNEANPKTARYVQAWKALHEKAAEHK
jgi:Zn-dependent M28 family amino/carboxypeptidase